MKPALSGVLARLGSNSRREKSTFICPDPAARWSGLLPWLSDTSRSLQIYIYINLPLDGVDSYPGCQIQVDPFKYIYI